MRARGPTLVARPVPSCRSFLAAALLAAASFSFVPVAATAGEPAPGVSLAPAEVALGRVYRATTTPFTLRATGEPGSVLEVSADHAVAETGLRAVGVVVRAPDAGVEVGKDATVDIALEFAVRTEASLGRGTVRVKVKRAGEAAAASAECVITFEVARGGLVAPERIDLGEVFVRGRARGELKLELRSATGASAWLDWTGLSGERSEILPAFVRPAARSVDLAPRGKVAVPLEVELPRGTRPGRYAGRLVVTAGPHRAEIGLELTAALPRLVFEPREMNLGTTAHGEAASAEARVRLEAAAPEQVEFELAGPLAKSGRPEALLDCLTVRPGDGAVVAAPDGAVTVLLEGVIPLEQEDGEYRGELLARAGTARAAVPVRLIVPRPEGLRTFVADPPEIAARAPKGGRAVAAVRVINNEDGPVEVRARLVTDAAGTWDVEIEDATGVDETSLTVPPRGEEEVRIVAYAPPDARVGDRAEARIVFDGAGLDARTDVALEVIRPSATARAPAPPPPAGRLPFLALALACAVATAAGWRVRPVRYGGVSSTAHFLVLLVGWRAPFVSSRPAFAGAERFVAIQVIQLEERFGEEAGGGPGGAGGAHAATGSTGSAGDGAPASSGGGEGEEGAAGQAAEGAGGNAPFAAALVPSHPDAPPHEAREVFDIARAPAPATGPVADGPSDGFDADGPAASISLLEPGEVKRARASGEERFGVVADEARSGLVARREATLVERVPVGAIPLFSRPERVPEAPGAPKAPQPGRAAYSHAAHARGRERSSLGGPSAIASGKTLGEARAKLARADAEALPPPSPTEVTDFPARAETSERLSVPGPAPARRPRPSPRAASRQPGRPGQRRGRAGPARTAAAPFPEPERPAPFAPPSSPRLARSDPRASLDAGPVPAPASAARAGERELPEEKVRLAHSGAPGRRPEVPERGSQTITRARGSSPAGLPGRALESFTRPGPVAPPAPMGAARLSRSDAGGLAPATLSPSRGAGVAGRLRSVRPQITFGTLKHAGDWGASPRAMGALARELPSRLNGLSLELRAKPVSGVGLEIFDCTLVYLTGRRDPGLDAKGSANLAKYLRRGGFLWIDDGASPGDGTFDRAARRLLGRLVPGATLRRVPLSHELFTSSYDLARGYLGRSVPAGAWARRSVIEGIFTPEGRLVAVYTRNGYGPAIQLDPDAAAAFRPPVGLTPREAREGALRVGANIAAYALRSAGRPVPRGGASEEFDPARRYRYRGPSLETVPGALDAPAWSPVRGGAPVDVDRGERGLVLDVGPSETDWAGAERAVPEGLASGKALVFDLRLGPARPARVALRFRLRGGDICESPPLYVRPGLNADLRVPLDGTDFRATATGFAKYDAALDRSKGIATFAVVLYGRDIAGKTEISRLRREGFGAR
ncbi:MAG: DUF4159 domain-containing protein [Planctomycetota bacterium]|jgi:hypothetical protein